MEQDPEEQAIDEQDEDLEKKSVKLKVNCPRCGRSLRGATQEMIGDTGVCPKCKAEFGIEQEDEKINAPNQLKMFAWKLIKSIGVIALTFGCVYAVIYWTGEKGVKSATTIGAFLILTELIVIWGPKSGNKDVKSKAIVWQPRKSDENEKPKDEQKQ